jgi:hypothetical protein
MPKTSELARELLAWRAMPLSLALAVAVTFIGVPLLAGGLLFSFAWDSYGVLAWCIASGCGAGSLYAVYADLRDFARKRAEGRRQSARSTCSAALVEYTLLNFAGAAGLALFLRANHPEVPLADIAVYLLRDARILF